VFWGVLLVLAEEPGRHTPQLPSPGCYWSWLESQGARYILPSTCLAITMSCMLVVPS
jgi:hypothetical protein